jgi:ATP-dependent protease HslVU (ClpYQ) peptidase subunit
MTCIVGISENGHVYIGGDSAGVAGLDLRIRRDEKVFRNGEFVFGCTTSFRMIQLLRYKLSVPKRHQDVDVMAYMTTIFIDCVREVLKNGGFASKEKESEQGGTFVVGYEGQLFKIYDDYQVAWSADGFDACGCGEAYALGSLYCTRNAESTPNQRLERALESAAHFSAGVIGPFNFETLG